jgi:molybdate/tungstate transport system ATP-binding protein
MLELRNIAARLGSLDMSEVSLKLDEGEYFVLLGPSGVGKTVLIEIIAGLVRPSGGQVFWEGRDITFWPPEARKFAVVYQDYALFPHLTVAENIAYGLRAAGAAREAIEDRRSELAEMLRIQGLMDRLPARLSGGEQQRVALARALAIRPKLLLLDEPLSALDTNSRARLQKELRQINRELGIPVFHVTHDPQEAMALGDRVGVMLNSRIRQVASVEDLFRRPSDPAVARFLGMKNVLPVMAAKDDLCYVRGVQIRVGSAPDSTTHLWIRPEEILLSNRPFDSSVRNQFEGRMVEWSYRDPLVAVDVAVGGADLSEPLVLTSLVSHTFFESLGLESGSRLYVTFKSSAVHFLDVAGPVDSGTVRAG